MVNIYVLDDDQEELDLMREVMEDTDGEKFHFFSDEKAFLEALNEQVDVAVIDNYLPGGAKGLEILQAIKKSNPKAKTIVVSGSTEPRMVIDYLNHDAFRFVDKNDPKYEFKLSSFVHRAITDAREVLEMIDAMQTIHIRVAQLGKKNGIV